MSTELRVEVVEPGADQEALDDLTRGLRRELLESDVDSVSLVTTGRTPAGSKGAELAEIGVLLVQVAASVEAVSTLIGAVRSWLPRDSSSRRSLKIVLGGNTLELTSATDAQQQRLIDEFLRTLPTDT